MNLMMRCAPLVVASRRAGALEALGMAALGPHPPFGLGGRVDREADLSHQTLAPAFASHLPSSVYLAGADDAFPLNQRLSQFSASTVAQS